MNDYYIMLNMTTPLNIIPLRAEPSHRSEMVSQVLFGEELFVLEKKGDFTKIRMKETSYEGWVQQTQVCPFTLQGTFLHEKIVGLEEVCVVHGNLKNLLLHGTKIKAPEIQIGKKVFHIEGELREPTLADFDTEFCRLVDYYLHSPYMWGGRSRFGIDCSGFTQACYAHFGVLLKRDAYQQAEMGITVDFLTEIKPGDLAFFDNEQGRITHVGIMIDSQTIAHASGRVRIDKMDQEGIFCQDEDRYTHKLRIVKRCF